MRLDELIGSVACRPGLREVAPLPAHREQAHERADFHLRIILAARQAQSIREVFFGLIEPVEQHQASCVGDAHPLIRRSVDPQRMTDAEPGLEHLRRASDIADIGPHDAPHVVQEHGIGGAFPPELLEQIERPAVQIVRDLKVTRRAQ